MFLTEFKGSYGEPFHLISSQFAYSGTSLYG